VSDIELRFRSTVRPTVAAVDSQRWSTL